MNISLTVLQSSMYKKELGDYKSFNSSAFSQFTDNLSFTHKETKITIHAFVIVF